MAASKRLIVYEPAYGGHQRVWLEILLRSALANDGGPALDFVLHPRLVDELSERWQAGGKVFRHSKAELGVAGAAPSLDSVVIEYRPDHLLLFELTPWEHRLGREKMPCRVSGVLFVQYPEIDWRAAQGVERWKRRVRRWIKERRTVRWLHRQEWGRVFLLQGARSASYLNARFPDRPVFDSIADPLPLDLTCEEQRTPRGKSSSAVNDPSTRIRFLHIGVLSARKGMDRILKALGGVSEAWASQCRLDILGRVESGFERPWKAALTRLRQRRPDLSIHWVPDELPEQEFREQIRAADCLLLPYLRTEYSSGLLGYAAALGTPVLGAADGLLGRLIKEYGLGRVTSTEPEALRVALEDARLALPEMSEWGRQKYCKDNDPQNFARKFLEVCRL